MLQDSRLLSVSGLTYPTIHIVRPPKTITLPVTPWLKLVFVVDPICALIYGICQTPLFGYAQHLNLSWPASFPNSNYPVLVSSMFILLKLL